jgi:hypothetical protein
MFGLRPDTSPAAPPACAEAEAAWPNVDVADQRRLDEGKVVPDIVQLSERHPMGDDEHDAVGLPGDADVESEAAGTAGVSISTSSNSCPTARKASWTLGTRWEPNRCSGSAPFGLIGSTMALPVYTRRRM